MSSPASLSGPLVPSRECGACQLCCVVPAIDTPEIQKRAGSPCRHSLRGGCDIYQTRPEPCRAFFCGWRRSRDFPDDWRPDRSGVLAVLEINEQPQFQSLAAALHLVGNPLKTVRRPDFLDFVAKSIRNNIALYLMLPTGPGMQSARMSLNNPRLTAAATKSRAEVKAVLEQMLKMMAAYQAAPHPMKHHGHDVST